NMKQHWSPIEELLNLQVRMNRLFEDATRRHSADGESPSVEREMERPEWIPAADVYERADHFELCLDLPGIDREYLDISVEKDSLVIRGVRRIESEKGQSIERPHGRFARKFGLPTIVD